MSSRRDSGTRFNALLQQYAPRREGNDYHNVIFSFRLWYKDCSSHDLVVLCWRTNRYQLYRFAPVFEAVQCHLLIERHIEIEIESALTFRNFRVAGREAFS